MDDKQTVEAIVRNIVASFSGIDSTEDRTNETIWFDAAHYACVWEIEVQAKFDESLVTFKVAKCAF